MIELKTAVLIGASMKMGAIVAKASDNEQENIYEFGKNLGIGLLIAFSYILFFQFSSTLSTNGDLEPWIAVWIPNFLYILLSGYIWR